MPEDVLVVINALKSKRKDSKEMPKILTDSHFKTGHEDFIGDYVNLYINSLLPYDRFIEVLNPERKKTY